MGKNFYLGDGSIYLKKDPDREGYVKFSKPKNIIGAVIFNILYGIWLISTYVAIGVLMGLIIVMNYIIEKVFNKNSTLFILSLLIISIILAIYLVFYYTPY